MMYPYITLADETLITHSHLIRDGNEKTVEVHFERPTDDGGFDAARCVIPTYEWMFRDGFTDCEIEMFEHMLRDGAHTFYKYAELGGMKAAKAV